MWSLKWIVITLFALPIRGTLLVHFWEYVVKPRMVPRGDIQALARRLADKHGPAALNEPPTRKRAPGRAATSTSKGSGGA